MARAGFLHLQIPLACLQHLHIPTALPPSPLLYAQCLLPAPTGTHYLQISTACHLDLQIPTVLAPAPHCLPSAPLLYLRFPLLAAFIPDTHCFTSSTSRYTLFCFLHPLLASVTPRFPLLASFTSRYPLLYLLQSFFPPAHTDTLQHL